MLSSLIIHMIQSVISYIILLPIWSYTVLHTRTNCVFHHSWVVLLFLSCLTSCQEHTLTTHKHCLPQHIQPLNPTMKENRSSASHFNNTKFIVKASFILNYCWLLIHSTWFLCWCWWSFLCTCIQITVIKLYNLQVTLSPMCHQFYQCLHNWNNQQQ